MSEFDELPVRHNEDKLNAAMSRTVRFPVDARTCDDPHTKANLLLQVGAGKGQQGGVVNIEAKQTGRSGAEGGRGGAELLVLGWKAGVAWWTGRWQLLTV